MSHFNTHLRCWPYLPYKRICYSGVKVHPFWFYYLMQFITIIYNYNFLVKTSKLASKKWPALKFKRLALLTGKLLSGLHCIN